MKNRDPRVDAYIAEAPRFAQPVLRRIRKVVHAACPEAREMIKWRFPTFVYEDKILCGMAAFQEHCTFGFWHQGMTAFVGGESGGTGRSGGGLGRIRTLADLPSDRTLAGLVRKAIALTDSGDPARPRPARRRAPLPVPPELAAALRKNKPAFTTFAKLSPSGRRDYIEWIGEAKRDDTKQKRLATTLEWLAEGKSRNWKYEDC